MSTLIDPAPIAATLRRLATRLVEDESIHDAERVQLEHGAMLLDWLARNADPIRALAQHIASKAVGDSDLAQSAEMELIKRHPLVLDLFAAFPDAEIKEVRPLEVTP